MTLAPAVLTARAQAWIAGDPDPATRAELSQLLASGDWGELEQRLQPLGFGTAGLRGAVGAGSGRMNRAVVIRAAHGLARYLQQTPSTQGLPIVIGFDARPTSRVFAEASAGVLRAAGFEVMAFTRPCATPLCAFWGRELGAAATIVVTASHNPRGDNGYKVYGPDAVQIVSPTDVEIARQIEDSPPAKDVPLTQVSFDEPSQPGLTLLEPGRLNSYFEALSAAISAGRVGREHAILHSALHGVGSEPMQRTLADAGFTRVSVVAAQAEPDGAFPTTPFPNPEEPGTLDLALAEAERVKAELLLVSDPDADRLAAAARLDGALTVLDGNQLGALLADYSLSRWARGSRALVLSSVVSSPLVAQIAAARDAHHARTHTGFKWLWHAALALEAQGLGKFCFAYEEALGYSVFSGVRDKDGIAAGRALAELSASLAESGATLFDRLFELYAEHGLWLSAARNISFSGGDAAPRTARALDRMVASAGLRVAGELVTRVVDFRRGVAERPPWLGAAMLLELELESGGRLFVRPSGTEPKLKLYGHVRGELSTRRNFAASLEGARRSVTSLLQELERALQL